MIVERLRHSNHAPFNVLSVDCYLSTSTLPARGAYKVHSAGNFLQGVNCKALHAGMELALGPVQLILSAYEPKSAPTLICLKCSKDTLARTSGQHQ